MLVYQRVYIQYQYCSVSDSISSRYAAMKLGNPPGHVVLNAVDLLKHVWSSNPSKQLASHKGFHQSPRWFVTFIAALELVEEKIYHETPIFGWKQPHAMFVSENVDGNNQGFIQ
jgi:hypothetical protein